MTNPDLLAELERVRGLHSRMHKRDAAVALFRRPDFLALIEALREPTDHAARVAELTRQWTDAEHKLAMCEGDLIAMQQKAEKAKAEAARILFLLRRALPYVENAIDDDMRDTLIAEIVWELTANDALRDSLKDTP